MNNPSGASCAKVGGAMSKAIKSLNIFIISEFEIKIIMLCFNQ
jgi:hypothetical protein